LWDSTPSCRRRAERLQTARTGTRVGGERRERGSGRRGWHPGWHGGAVVVGASEMTTGVSRVCDVMAVSRTLSPHPKSPAALPLARPSAGANSAKVARKLPILGSRRNKPRAGNGDKPVRPSVEDYHSLSRSRFCVEARHSRSPSRAKSSPRSMAAPPPRKTPATDGRPCASPSRGISPARNAGASRKACTVCLDPPSSAGSEQTCISPSSPVDRHLAAQFDRHSCRGQLNDAAHVAFEARSRLNGSNYKAIDRE